METERNTKKQIPVIAVVGPTASGKTAVAVEMALRFGGEVISADSMQVYRGMEIATAKPTSQEKKGVPHLLMDFLDPGEAFSVADYAALAHKEIKRVHERGKLPILAGGTGLYLDAVLNDIAFSEMKSDEKLREELNAYADEKGPGALRQLLCECDPKLAESLHENNRGRILRAIEVFRLTGIPMSEHQRRSREQPSRYRALKIGLCFRDREKLYDRINRRVDQMMERGLLLEAEAFLSSDFLKTAAQAIGYKELAGFFEGRLTLDEAVESLKRGTRRYAKRQLTWFRRDETIQWFYMDDGMFCELEKNIAHCMENFLKICYDENNTMCLPREAEKNGR